MDFKDKDVVPSDTTALLHYLYADLSRISQVSADHVMLHQADRDLHTPPKPPIRGVEAVQAHEDALIAICGGTLVMDVESVTANAHFGCVMGVLRADGKGENAGKDDIAIPFCGLWRFDNNGKAVEHWENAADPQEMVSWMQRNGRL